MFWKRQSPPSPRERSEVPKPVMVLLRQWDRLVEKDGILYQQTSRPDGGEEVLQLVLPDALKSLGLQLRQLQGCERCQTTKDSGLVSHSYVGHL